MTSEEAACRVVVYSIVGCPHCKRAKHLLSSKGIPYVEINLDAHPDKREEMRKLSSQRTVPQIFFNAFYVGDSSKLHTLEESGDLQALYDQHKAVAPGEGAPSIPKNMDVRAVPALDDVCNPDEHSELLVELRHPETGLPIKDRNGGLFKKKKKRCFTGRELVNWLVSRRKAQTEQDACAISQQMIESLALRPLSREKQFVPDESLYRFWADEKIKSLNNTTCDCRVMEAVEVSELLRKKILQMYDQFLSVDGRAVDYNAMGDSELFEEYTGLTSLLHRANLSTLNHDDKLAFFINIYNALVIHANVSAGPPTTFWQRSKFFNSWSYNIGGHNFTLNDIENGVLRANRVGAGALSRQFRKKDPRLEFCVSVVDPRIHFALVCGAKSCPPIKTYSSANVQEALTLAATAFLGGGGLLIEGNTVKPSKILDWYKVDFGGSIDNVLSWCSSFLEPDKQTELKRVLSGNYNVAYQAYDWSVNSK